MRFVRITVAIAALVIAVTTLSQGQVAQKVQIRPSMLARIPQVKLAGSWIPSPSGTARITLPSRLQIRARNTYTSLVLKVPGFASDDVKGPDGTTYQRLTIPNGGVTADVGKPELPTVGAYVEVPTGVRVRVTATPIGEARILDGYLVWPAQEPAPDLTGAPTPPFAKNVKAYRTDAFVPANMVYATSPGTVRGVSVVHVSVCPILHNPAKRQIKVSGQVRVRVEFVGTPIANWQARRTKYASAEFSPVLKTVVPCFAPTVPWKVVAQVQTPVIPGLATTPKADYLIICPSGWQDTANRMAAWREANGLLTRVVATSNIPGGNSAQGIANYIKNAYDSWVVPPGYVLLLGDVNRIPTFYKTAHPSSYETNFKSGTDLYYATVDGPDIFPDIALGRLPAANETQAGILIDKVIAYEQNPPAGNWTNKALVAAGYQAGRYFHITSNAIADFLQGKGYNVTKVYHGGSYTGTPAQVTNAINGGVFLVTHRDHGNSSHGPYGGSDGWSHPSWTATQASALTNGAMQPVVFTINCRTGWFDDESDEDTSDPGGDCLAEAFIRGNNKGAVGVVGATRISYSGYNDELAKGFIDAIWPDFDPGYSGGAPVGARLGQVLNAGKMWMYDKYVLTAGGTYGWTVTPLKTTTEFEIFHLLGDPAMRMWTGPVSNLLVSFTRAGGNKAKVTVRRGSSAVARALVVIQKPGQVSAWKKGATGSDGTWVVELDAPDQRVMVTASKAGYRPFHRLLKPSPLGLAPVGPVKIDRPKRPTVLKPTQPK